MGNKNNLLVNRDNGGCLEISYRHIARRIIHYEVGVIDIVDINMSPFNRDRIVAALN